ncbi:hypothetical protein SUNI508_05469 [Seiridium unicorne]|uniref:Uncharacterized protein n=1 Tax=Seiridium unicorne TaxID=138068 RepID=A0ABR2V4N7_9PEZI
MLFKSTILSAMALVFASQAIGAAMPAGQDVSPRAALIATDPVSACNCPNNCSHKAGSGCQYKAGVSTDGSTVSGSCFDESGTLTCVPK